MIDSHVHITHYRFENEFPYLSVDKNGKCISVRGTRDRMTEEMKAAGITGVIDPAISFYSNEKILHYAKKYPDFIFAAIGRHPNDCWRKTSLDAKGAETRVSWKDRIRLDSWVHEENVVAIGETGLDYHYTQKRVHKRLQRKWFIYQIKLAFMQKLPLILHIRDADRDAIRILKRRKRKLCGGVVHCFCGDVKTMREYVKLGLHLGIGGSLLKEDIASAGLRNAVKEAPLDRLIVETDAPYVLPDKECFAEEVKRKKLRNTSLLLPSVIREIAKIKGLSFEEVNQAVYKNTCKLFHLTDMNHRKGE